MGEDKYYGGASSCRSGCWPCNQTNARDGRTWALYPGSVAGLSPDDGIASGIAVPTLLETQALT